MDTHKNDDGKLRYDVVPEEWETALALIMSFGAKKYGKDTWQKVPQGKDRYYSALRRHLAAFRLGEIRDSESGFPHLWHVAVNALMLQHYADMENDAQETAPENEEFTEFSENEKEERLKKFFAMAEAEEEAEAGAEVNEEEDPCAKCEKRDNCEAIGTATPRPKFRKIVVVETRRGKRRNGRH